MAGGDGDVVAEVVGRRDLDVTAGDHLANDVRSGGEIGEGVDAGAARDCLWIAGLEDAGVVQVDVHHHVANAVAVGDVDDGAGDRGGHDGSGALIAEVGVGGRLPGGQRDMIAKAVGGQSLLVAAGENLSNEVSAGAQTREGVNARGVGRGFEIAGFEDSSIGGIDVDADVGDAQLAGILFTVAVGVIENGPGDGPTGRRRRRRYDCRALIAEIDVGRRLIGGEGDMVAESQGWESLLVAAGQNLANEVSAGG